MISIVYIIVFFIIFFAAQSEVNSDEKQSKLFFYSVIAILIILGGFRYYQGADYPIYVNLFYAAQYYVPWDKVFDADVEVTFVVISKLVGEVMHLPFYWVTFFYAFISLSLKGNFFENYSPYPFLSLLLFYSPVIFFEDYGQMRQGASIAICAYSFRYIVDRKLIYFLLTMVVAYFFHKSAIFFIFAYWIAPLKINTSTALTLVVLSVLLYPFKVYRLIEPAMNFIATERLSEAYTGYLNDTYYGVELSLGYSDFIKLIWLIIIFSFDRQLLPVGKKYLYPRNLTLFFFIVFYLFRGNTIFAVRLPGAYAFYLYLLIPTIAFYLDAYYRRIVVNYVYIFTIAIFIRFQPNAVSGGFNRFQNVLFMKDPEFKNEVF